MKKLESHDFGKKKLPRKETPCIDHQTPPKSITLTPAQKLAEAARKRLLQLNQTPLVPLTEVVHKHELDFEPSVPYSEDENLRNGLSQTTSHSNGTTLLRNSLSGSLKHSFAPVPRHLIVVARAGTGKTTTLIEGLKVMKGMSVSIDPSPQQRAIWDSIVLSKDAHTICMAAFNSSIAKELKQRVPPGVEAKTLHGLGFYAFNKAFPTLRGRELNEYRVKDLTAELLQMNRREMYSIPSMSQVLIGVNQLVDLCKMNLADGGIESLILLADHHGLDLGEKKEQIFELVPEVLELCKDPHRGGMIDYCDMIWLPVVLNLPVFLNDLFLVDEFQDLNRCQQALARRAGKRIIGVGDPAQCHPAGTLVTKTGGQQVPIESLKVGDSLVTFNPNQGRLAGLNSQGRRVEAIAHRDYTGDLYNVNETECTPCHKWPTKFDESKRGWTALYLMELNDNSFRIGITQLMLKGGNGFGPSLRARQEGAIQLWLLDVIEDRNEAREHEFKNSLRYRVPQRAQYEEGEDSWPSDLINEGFEPEVDKLLERYGRLYEFPIWKKDDSQHIGSKQVYITQTCNLIPTVNMVARRVGDSQEVNWEITDMDIVTWSGEVWSLQVQPTEKDRRLYLANGIVTSNSIYGFAGSDSESMERMTKELDAEVLSLNVTRRCGKAIVFEAQKMVPDFEAHLSNPQGEVKTARYGTKENPNPNYRSQVRDGDMVLCRNNAPLVNQCFKFLREGRKATIQGRKDIGRGLIDFINRVKGKMEPGTPENEIPRFIAVLSEWLKHEEDKENAKKDPKQSKLDGLRERYDCLVFFCEELDSVDAIVKKIDIIFTDNQHTPGIILSSIHKSKGLESERVFLLIPPSAPCPMFHSKMKPWQCQQERNLCYVAVTRAIKELTYVS